MAFSPSLFYLIDLSGSLPDAPSGSSLLLTLIHSMFFFVLLLWISFFSVPPTHMMGKTPTVIQIIHAIKIII